MFGFHSIRSSVVGCSLKGLGLGRVLMYVISREKRGSLQELIEEKGFESDDETTFYG